MIIFTNLANVFIQNGFNTALIQKRDTSDNDYSSVFWLTFVFSLLIYAFLFLIAPIIAIFYSMPNIIFPFRVLALMIIPGALNSIQIAIVSKKMDFKKIFTSNFLSIIVSGIIGVSLAFLGMGVWALVFQAWQMLSFLLLQCGSQLSGDRNILWIFIESRNFFLLVGSC